MDGVRVLSGTVLDAGNIAQVRQATSQVDRYVSREGLSQFATVHTMPYYPTHFSDFLLPVWQLEASEVSSAIK